MKRNRSTHDDEDDYQPPTRKSAKKQVKSTPSPRVTRLMKLDAARRGVFETVELLENIFEQLPPREIIVCERVCRQCKDVIDSSHKIQRKLFKEVSDSGESWKAGQISTPHTGSLWSKSVERRFEHALPFRRSVDDIYASHQVCQLNEALFVVDKHMVRPSRTDHAGFGQLFDGTSVRLRPKAQHILLDMSKGKTGSWANMHITSPPCREVQVRARLQLSGTQVCRIKKHILSPSGITLGELARQLSASTGCDEFGRGNERIIFHASIGARKEIEHCSGTRLSDFLTGWESKHGFGVTIHRAISDPLFTLKNVVLPTDEEMEEVRGRKGEVSA